MLATLLTRIGGVLSGVWVKVAGVVVAIAAAAAVYAAIRRSGRDAERAETRGTIIKDVEKRHEIDSTVAREPDPAGRLRDKWSRD